MKKFISMLVVLSLVLVILAGCGGAGETNGDANANDPIIIKLAGTMPVEHQLSRTTQLFADEVNANSNGELKVEFYPAGQLYNDTTMVEAIPQGGIEMGVGQTANWTGVSPTVGYYTLCSYFDDYDWFQRCVHGEPGRICIEALENDVNVKILTVLNYGECDLVSKKPLAKAADFDGVRLRMLGEFEGLWLQAMGGAPVAMAASENYEAIQKGTIDGASTGRSSTLSRKLYEVADYVTLGSQIKQTQYFLACNKDFWEGLSSEHQAILTDAAQAALEYNKIEAPKSDAEATEKLIELGVTMVEITPEDLAEIQSLVLPPILDAYKEDVGQEMFDKLMSESEALKN